MKRSRLKRKPRTAAETDLADARREWLFRHPCCMVPGCRRPSQDIHEIARGGARAQAVKDQAAWLGCCRAHHEEFDDAALWPVVRQLGVKLLADPGGYNRRRVNMLRGRAPDAITYDEVVAEAAELRGAVP